MDLFYLLLGGFMIYSTVHFFIIQRVAWEKRTTYERFISVTAMVIMGLVYLSLMLGE